MILTLLAALAAGMGLGVIFFGGLLLTTRRLARARRPMLLVAVSFTVRTGLVLAGFAALAWCQWQRVAVALLGFVVVRFLLVRRAMPPAGGRRAARDGSGQ